MAESVRRAARLLVLAPFAVAFTLAWPAVSLLVWAIEGEGVSLGEVLALLRSSRR